MNRNSSGNDGLGDKVKGAFQAIHGIGENIRGTALGAIDTITKDGTRNDQIAQRGRLETSEGLARMRGGKVTGTPATGGQYGPAAVVGNDLGQPANTNAHTANVVGTQTQNTSTTAANPDYSSEGGFANTPPHIPGQETSIDSTRPLGHQGTAGNLGGHPVNANAHRPVSPPPPHPPNAPQGHTNGAVEAGYNHGMGAHDVHDRFEGGGGGFDPRVHNANTSVADTARASAAPSSVFTSEGSNFRGRDAEGGNVPPPLPDRPNHGTY
ncbi:hypothetical protein ONZ45_g4884 [Pleurotus djamor]|nr:hypothetical protein ONZ45_g4884 [Pleurotus djamor]